MQRKIYALSDSPFLNTGYSSQMLFLLNGLVDKGWEAHYQVTNQNYTGQILPPNSVKLADGTPFKFTLYSAGLEAYAKDVLAPRINKIRPDIFVTLLDSFMVMPWWQSYNWSPALSSFWFPSDGGGRLPLNSEYVVKGANIPVAMSKYAQKQAWEKHGIKSHYIPLGINPSLFYPYTPEKKLELKAQQGLKNKFVVGIVGRNQGRKSHDRAVEIFASFSKRHPEAILLCHLDPQDAAAGFDILTLAADLDIKQKVLLTGVKYYEGFTYEKMNEVYNLFDVYLSSTSGEGFGLTAIEAMACEIPVLVTNYTTTQELVIDNNAGEGINLLTEHTGSLNVKRGVCSIADGVERLEKMYFDHKLREKYGKNGRKAVFANYTTDIVINAWDKLLTNELSKL